MGYSPWGHREPDTTDQLTRTHTHTYTHTHTHTHERVVGSRRALVSGVQQVAQSHMYLHACSFIDSFSRQVIM